MNNYSLKTRLSTFYSNGQVLLQDRIELSDLPQNPDLLLIPFEVPTQIIPESINSYLKIGKQSIIPLDFKTELTNESQSLLQPFQLYQEWTGKWVQVQTSNSKSSFEGKLLHIEEVGTTYLVILQKGKRKTILTNVISISLKEENQDLEEEQESNTTNQIIVQVSGPSPQWLRHNTLPSSVYLDLSYLSNGMQWNCNYSLLLSSDNLFINGQSKATISNTTGFEIQDTKLKFVVGNPNPALSNTIRKRGMGYNNLEMRTSQALVSSAAPSSSNSVQSSESQYYVLNVAGYYQIPPYKQTQLVLFHFTELPVLPWFKYMLSESTSYGIFMNNRNRRLPRNYADWGIKFNTEQRIWPPGIVTVYQENNNSSTISSSTKSSFSNYVGSNRILEAVPPGEFVDIKLGKTQQIYGSHQSTLTDKGVQNRGGYVRAYLFEGSLLIENNDIGSLNDLYLIYPNDLEASISITESKIQRNMNMGISTSNSNNTKLSLVYEGIDPVDGHRWRVIGALPGDELLFRVNFTLSTQG